MKLLFILSLPRAGSTLLQRLLMAHPKIHSCGEPWLGLPLVKLPESDLTFSTFGHASVARSLQHLIDLLPGGRKDYLDACGGMMEEIYSKLVRESGVTYFLDKTPRYYQIIPELAEMFPDAKFIILHRDLPAVYASILNYIGGDLRYLPTWKQDIVEGYPALHRGRELLGQRAHNLDYVDLVKEPQHALQQIIAYLDLPWEEGLEDKLENSQVPRGDPTGSAQYRAVSTDSLGRWRSSIDSRAKRDEGVRWLSKLKNMDVGDIDIELGESLQELKDLPVSFNFQDACRLGVGKVYFNYQMNAVRWGIRRRKMHETSSIY